MMMDARKTRSKVTSKGRKGSRVVVSGGDESIQAERPKAHIYTGKKFGRTSPSPRTLQAKNPKTVSGTTISAKAAESAKPRGVSTTASSKSKYLKGSSRTRATSSAAAPKRRSESLANSSAISELTEPLTSTLHEIVGRGAMGAGKLAAALTQGSPQALQSLRDLIDRTLATLHGDDSLAQDVWGKEPTRAEMNDARAKAEYSRAVAVEQTVRDSLTRDEVAKRLGISAQAVSKRVKADQLVVLQHGGRGQYPLWQFADDGVIAAIPDLVHAFPSTLSLSMWMTTPSADLDGLTPTQMLHHRHGQSRVLELAQAVSPAAW